MTTDLNPSPADSTDPWRDVRPEDLPAVEPPSAGFIVQLFVVPLLIVAVVIGIYVLFGQLATAEQDWRQLVTDVKSENPHVKWRGALGLAQMLDTDTKRGAAGQNLASNRDIAIALADLYAKLINAGQPNAEELQQIEFLSKAVGQMDVDDIVFPVLRTGIDAARELDVRKHSLTGIALVAGRAFEKKRSWHAPGLTRDLITVSQEPVPLYRHQAAFILGLIDDPAARARLTELLDDGDQMVRLNSAIGLSRSNSTAGVQVFEELLKSGPAWKLNPASVQSDQDEAQYFERVLMLSNALRAIHALNPQLSPESRMKLVPLIEALEQSTSDSVLRQESRQTIQELTSNAGST